jgi:hypothetical protein
MRRARRVAGAEFPSRRAWTRPRHSCGVAALPPQPLSRLLGLDGPVISDPIPLDRNVVDNPEPQYVTFVNPQLPKGVAVFARIAIELDRKRPEIPPSGRSGARIRSSSRSRKPKKGADPAKPPY